MAASGSSRLRLLADNRPFARLAGAITVSALGDPLTQIAALVTIYAVTQNPLVVAAAFVIQALAALLMSTLFGGLADRFSRRWLVIRLGFARALLLFCTPFLLAWSLWSILPILFLLAFANAVVTPAQQSSVPLLVPEGRVGAANSIVFGLNWVAQALGATLASVVLLAWPHLPASLTLATPATTGLFLLDGLTFLAAALLLLPLPTMGGAHKVQVTAALRTTWTIVQARSHLLLATAASFVLGLAFPTFIILAYRLVGTAQGAPAYSWLEATTSVSLFVGAVLLGRFRSIGTMRTAAFGLAVGGLFSLPIVLLPLLGTGWLPFWLALGLLALASIGNPIYSVANSTALVLLASEHNRGSVMATRFGLAQTALMVGVAAGGGLNALAGPFVTFGCVGLGFLALAACARFLPAVPRPLAA
jgi:MFS family permease